MSRAARVVFASALMLLSARAAVAQTTSPPAASTTWTLRDWTRVEMWRFFLTPPGRGSQQYTLAAKRPFWGGPPTAPPHDLTAAPRYYQFGGGLRSKPAPPTPRRRVRSP